MRRLTCLSLLATALCAVLSSPAQAARLVLPETLTTAHFQMHYDGAPLTGTPVQHQGAGDLAATFETAYSALGAWGYPLPLDDGDGRIDVYITDLSPYGALGAAFQDNPSNSQSSGYIWIDDDSTGTKDTAMHELFHLVQFGIWGNMDAYVLEGSAEWAGFRFLNFPLNIDLGIGGILPLAATLGSPDMSLTCVGTACGTNGYDVSGYSRWNFYEYLSERYGSGTVNDLFQTGKSLNNPSLTGVDLLVQTMLAKGAGFSDVFTDFTVANMSGAYSAAGLKGVLPQVYASLATGAAAGALPAKDVAVNHLAARYLTFTRDAGATGQCYAATLTINVALPAGLGARPYFYLDAATSTPIPLAVSGSSASLSIPWDTCKATDKTGYLSLPNPSTTADAALFTVSPTLERRQDPDRHCDAAPGRLVHRPDRADTRCRGVAVDRALRPGEAPRLEEEAPAPARRLLERRRPARGADRRHRARSAQAARR